MYWVMYRSHYRNSLKCFDKKRSHDTYIFILSMNTVISFIWKTIGNDNQYCRVHGLKRKHSTLNYTNKLFIVQGREHS